MSSAKQNADTKRADPAAGLPTQQSWQGGMQSQQSLGLDTNIDGNYTVQLSPGRLDRAGSDESVLQQYQQHQQISNQQNQRVPISAPAVQQLSPGRLDSAGSDESVLQQYQQNQQIPNQQYQRVPISTPAVQQLSPGRLDSAGSDDSVLQQYQQNQQVPNQPNQRVPIPARGSTFGSIGSPHGEQQAQVVPASGPMSCKVKIPARPRPGRKPIAAEDAVDRRRYQNRLAQRNFRDKRQQKLHDAQLELAAKSAEYKEELCQLKREIQDWKDRFASEQAAHAAVVLQLQAEKQRADALSKQVQDAAHRQSIPAMGTFRPDPLAASFSAHAQRDVPTPPEESYQETDFTDYSRTRRPSYLRPSNTNDSDDIDFSMADRPEDKCGFCTDDQNCACKQGQANTALPPVTVPSAKSLPGTCDMCQADPERARQCREMAEKANMADKPRPVIMGPPKYSCSEMINQFNKFGQRTSTISSLFGGALHTYPAEQGSGYTLDDHEAADVLQALSRRSADVDNKRRASQAKDLQ